MPVFVSEFLSQIKSIWSQLSAGQRATIATVVVATLVGMASLIYFGTRPELVSIASLTGEDRQAAVNALSDAGIHVDVSGEVIRVYSGDRSEALTVLAARNINSGDTSSGSSDSFAFGADKDTRKWHLLMAQVARFEQQIRRMKGVLSASVNPNIPPRGVFIGRDRTPPSASVFLRLSEHVSLSRIGPQIVALVANGLGIPRGNVSILTGSGEYTEADGAGGKPDFNELLRLEGVASHVLTAKARMLLERLYPSKSFVEVQVRYDNRVIESNKKLLATSKVVKRESTYKTTDTSAAPATGDPNAAANGANSGSGSNSTVTQSEKDYEPIIGEEKVRLLAPSVSKVSMMLVLDESLRAQQADIETQIKQLIGWDATRDGVISSMVSKFPTPEDVAPEGPSIIDMVKEYGPIGGQVLSVLFVLMFLRGLLRKSKATETVAPDGSDDEEDKEVDPVEAAERMRREIETVVAKDPARVSRLLESWLSDKSA